MSKITEITKGVQVVSEEGSMIHEDSLLRTIGHTISLRDFLVRTTEVVGAVAITKNSAAAAGMPVTGPMMPQRPTISSSSKRS